MTAVSILRQLSRLRIFVAAALVFACLVGIAITYQIGFPPKSRQHNVGVASASALVDSSKSQVADLSAGAGSDAVSLAARASLLASLMATSPIKDDIAARGGVPANLLVATPPPSIGTASSPAPAVTSASASSSDPRASTLNISIPNVQAGQLPIIQVSTQARTEALAARIANAAFAALQADVSSVATADNVPTLQRLVVRALGPANSGVVSQGPGPLFGLLGAIGAFVLACAAILGVSSLAATWRAQSDLSEINDGQPIVTPMPASRQATASGSDAQRTRPGNVLPYGMIWRDVSSDSDPASDEVSSQRGRA